MDPEEIRISRIIKKTTNKPKGNYYVVIWVKDDIEGIEIDGSLIKNVSNTLFFLDPIYEWKILTNNDKNSKGYTLFLPKNIFNTPSLNKLHITEVSMFSENEIPRINLSPGIEIRVQYILEMLDELIGSHLNHKDQAILSLLNTFFIYCDGQCNIKSKLNDNSTKSGLVYKFKKLVTKNLSHYHEVKDYANLLHISAKYLNECVQDVLGVNAKSIIVEQLVLNSRRDLKFSDKTIKEISFDLGFSSPDYFSFFFKNQTGVTPSYFRKN